ncbi:MAG: DMT family transporter [Xanthobacteraceae bacterium]|nr:DMT family transporter [Xanthobacteraceae bacterium]
MWEYMLVSVASVSFVFQQAVNANLRSEIGSPWLAGLVSYAGGTFAMLIMAVVLQERLPSTIMLGRSSWLSWSGGIFGTVYIAISIIMLPRLGAATVIALIVAGQMLGSLAFDHFGFLGVPIHQLTNVRVIGAVLLVIGAALTRL